MSTTIEFVEENKLDEEKSSNLFSRYEIFGLISIFVIAFAIRFWFNFISFHVNAYSNCDAWEYLTDAKSLAQLANLPTNFWLHSLTYVFGGASANSSVSIHNAFSSLGGLHQSGAIFPIFLALSYALLGTPVEPTNWVPPILVQSVLSSLTCVLITLSARHAWNRSTAVLAGLISALYPAFIINSGRLYSETFACFLLCAIAWLTLRGFKKEGNGLPALFLLGVTSAALQMTRSIMFVLSIVLLPIIGLQQKEHRRWTSIISFILGAFLCIAPWMVVQKLAFGSGSLIVDRVSHYNFFTGNNPDTQGWLSFPYPDGRGIEKRSFIQLTQESYKHSPNRWFKLMLDKPERLLKFPWNDFRTSLGVLSFHQQVLIHQLILLLAVIGIALGLTVSYPNRPLQRQLYSRLFLLGVGAYQLVYMAFITVPRYNLTIMPFIIMFAAAGLISLVQMIRNRSSFAPYIVLAAALLLYDVEQIDWLSILHSFSIADNPLLCLFTICLIKLLCVSAFVYALIKAINSAQGNHTWAKIATLVCGVFALASLCLPVRANGRWYEWQQPLDHRNQLITQNIVLPPSAITNLRTSQTYLMIDSNGVQPINGNVAISINGQLLDSPLIPSLSLVDNLNQFERHGGNDLFLACEYIFDCLTRPSGITNLDTRQWFLLPVSKDSLNPGNVQVQIRKLDNTNTTFFGGYQTNSHYLEIPSPTLYSWEKAFYGVENNHGLTDTRYDTKLLLNDSKISSSNYFIHLLQLPSPNGKQIESIIKIPVISNTIILSYPRSSTKQITQLPAFKPTELWLIRVVGEVKCLTNNSTYNYNPAMVIKFHSANKTNQFTYTSPWSMRKINAQKNWTKFDYAFPINPNAFPGKLKDLEIGLYAFDPLSGNINIPQNWHPESMFRNVSIEIENLPSLPFSTGYKIY